MDSLFSRYASALFSIAVEEGKIKDYRDEIKMLRKVIIENNDLLHLLSSCFISNEEKENIIDKVFVNQNINVVNFIKVINSNKRINYIIKIFDEFIKTCNEKLNVKEGIIYSTTELTESQITKLEKALSQRLNSQVELTNSIDERLIGGVKIVIEDKVFDGSVKNKLEKLKQSLISGGNC